MSKLLDRIVPKIRKVEILLPDKSLWVTDKAKDIPIEGMMSELKLEEKIMILTKSKQLIPKFKPQRYKTFLGLKEKFLLYTPDYVNYLPLNTSFKDNEFGVEPENYNHRLMKGLLKTHQITRFKKDKWWEQYMPIIFIVMLIVASTVYIRASLTEMKEITEIWQNIQEGAIGVAQQAEKLPSAAKPPQP